MMPNAHTSVSFTQPLLGLPNLLTHAYRTVCLPQADSSVSHSHPGAEEVQGIQQGPVVLHHTRSSQGHRQARKDRAKLGNFAAHLALLFFYEKAAKQGCLLPANLL